MKKLMTMLSAVALGFGLNASAAFTDTGTSFEGMDEGPLDTASATGELVPNSSGYWSATNENCAATVTAGTSIARDEVYGEEFLTPTQFNQTEHQTEQKKYLSVQTTFGNALTRKAKTSGAVNIVEEGTDGSFYIDTLVQFSIFDEDPTFTNSAGVAVYEDAKLAIWLQQDDPDFPTVTNLYVRAGTVGGEAQNYYCGPFTGRRSDANNSPADWHRLTVKAIANIYNSEAATSVPGFVVFVDNEMIAVGSTTQSTGINRNQVSGTYERFANQNALFPSLDLKSQNKQMITAVDFDGKGAVDDIVFTAKQPFAAAEDDSGLYAHLNWDDHVTGLTYSVDNGDAKTLTDDEIANKSLGIAYKADEEISLSVTGITYAEGYCGASTVNVTLNSDNKYAYAIESKEAAASFGGVSYETLNDAFSAAQNATTSGTFKLFADCKVSVGEDEDSTLAFYNKEEIVIDLNGKTVDGGIASYLGSLVIKDSSDQDKVGLGTGMVNGWVGAITDSGDGGAETATLEIRGGKYQKSNGTEDINTLEALNGYAMEGYAFTLVDNYFVLTEASVATVNGTGYKTLQEAIDAAITLAKGETDGDDTATAGDDATTETTPVTVEICSDITLTETLVIASDDAEKVAFTINTPKGYTVTSDPTNGSDPGVTIDGVTLTFTGDGTWQKTSGSKTFICVGEKTASVNVLVEGGTFTAAASHVMTVMNGIIAVTGGTFETKGSDKYCVRAEMSELESLSSGYGVIVVTGGTFTNPTTAADGNGVPIAPVGIKGAVTNTADGASVYINVNGTAKFAGNKEAICGPMENFLVTIDGTVDEPDYTDASEDYKFKLDDDYYVATEIQWSAIKVTWDANLLSWAGNDGEDEDDAESWTKTEGETKTEDVFEYDIDETATFTVTNYTFATGYELDSDKSVLTIASPTTANVTNEITIVSKQTQAVTPLDPTDANGTTYDSAEDATKAAEEFNEALKTNPELIEVPSVVTSEEDKAAYRALFEAVADGTTVKLDFTPVAKEDLETAAETAVESIELQTFAASDGTAAQNLLTVKKAIPGLWYTLLTGTDTPANLPTAHSQQAETSEVKFNVTKDADTDRAFFRMKITTTEVQSTGLTN